ncbi:hypothetical protein ACLX1H_008582 [Fusarium chlamydosporum]
MYNACSASQRTNLEDFNAAVKQLGSAIEKEQEANLKMLERAKGENQEMKRQLRMVRNNTGTKPTGAEPDTVAPGPVEVKVDKTTSTESSPGSGGLGFEKAHLAQKDSRTSSSRASVRNDSVTKSTPYLPSAAPSLPRVASDRSPVRGLLPGSPTRSTSRASGMAPPPNTSHRRSLSSMRRVDNDDADENDKNKDAKTKGDDIARNSYSEKPQLQAPDSTKARYQESGNADFGNLHPMMQDLFSIASELSHDYQEKLKTIDYEDFFGWETDEGEESLDDEDETEQPGEIPPRRNEPDTKRDSAGTKGESYLRKENQVLREENQVLRARNDEIEKMTEKLEKEKHGLERENKELIEWLHQQGEPGAGGIGANVLPELQTPSSARKTGRHEARSIPDTPLTARITDTPPQLPGVPSEQSSPASTSRGANTHDAQLQEFFDGSLKDPSDAASTNSASQYSDTREEVLINLRAAVQRCNAEIQDCEKNACSPSGIRISLTQIFNHFRDTTTRHRLDFYRTIMYLGGNPYDASPRKVRGATRFTSDASSKGSDLSASNHMSDTSEESQSSRLGSSPPGSSMTGSIFNVANGTYAIRPLREQSEAAFHVIDPPVGVLPPAASSGYENDPGLGVPKPQHRILEPEKIRESFKMEDSSDRKDPTVRDFAYDRETSVKDSLGKKDYNKKSTSSSNGEISKKDQFRSKNLQQNVGPKTSAIGNKPTRDGEKGAGLGDEVQQIVKKGSSKYLPSSSRSTSAINQNHGPLWFCIKRVLRFFFCHFHGWVLVGKFSYELLCYLWRQLIAHSDAGPFPEVPAYVYFYSIGNDLMFMMIVYLYLEIRYIHLALRHEWDMWLDANGVARDLMLRRIATQPSRWSLWGFGEDHGL